MLEIKTNIIKNRRQKNYRVVSRLCIESETLVPFDAKDAIGLVKKEHKLYLETKIRNSVNINNELLEKLTKLKATSPDKFSQDLINEIEDILYNNQIIKDEEK